MASSPPIWDIPPSLREAIESATEQSTVDDLQRLEAALTGSQRTTPVHIVLAKKGVPVRCELE